MNKCRSHLLRGIFSVFFLTLSSNVSASPQVAVGVDYLYLKPYVNDLDFAFIVPRGVIELNENTVDGTGKYIDVRLKFESAVRGYAMLRNCACGLNLGSSYTYFHGSNSKSKTVATPGSLLATLTHGGLEIANITFAKGEWDLNFQLGDLVLSYDFYCHPHQRVTPFIGGVMLIIDQEVKAHYKADSTGDSSSFDSDFRYTAFGMIAGVEYNHTLTDNFQLYAKASGSLVTGLAKSVDVTKRRLNGEEEEFADLNLKFNERLLIPGCHLAIGALYHECVCGFDLGLRIGYEFIAWYGIGNPGRFAKEGIHIGTGGSRSTATFGLQGVVCGLQVGF